MRLWRLCRRPFADLSGEGARLHGGRWNSPGRPVVYLAAEPSLAVLEVRVHLDLPLDLMPPDYVLLTVEVPDTLAVEQLAQAPDDARAAGDGWLDQGRTALLSVPSVIVPEARNLLLNPRHADAGRVRVAAVRPFGFDPRLFG